MAKLGYRVRVRGTPFAGDVHAQLNEHGQTLYRIMWDNTDRIDSRLYRADDLENAEDPYEIESRRYTPSVDFDRKTMAIKRIENAAAGFNYDPKRTEGVERI